MATQLRKTAVRIETKVVLKHVSRMESMGLDHGMGMAKEREVSDLGERGGYLCVDAKLLQSCLTLCSSMDYNPPGSSVLEFSRQEYCNRLPGPLPGDLSHTGWNPHRLCLRHWQTGYLSLAPPGKPR